jgi:hypothetical protein
MQGTQLRETPRRLHGVPTFCQTYRRPMASYRVPVDAEDGAYHLVAGFAVFLQGRSRGFESLRAHQTAGQSPSSCHLTWRRSFGQHNS